MDSLQRSFIDAVCPPRLLAICLLVVIAGCNPMAAWTNNQSGKAFYRAGRYAEAREEFRRATADSPRNPDYIHNYATASRQAGDPISAEQAYRQALMLDPSHQPSYHGLAVTYLETGRSAEAHSLLSNWVATQPYSERPHIEMAWLQQEMGDLTGAERSLAQALQIRPNHPLAMANLGNLYERTGRTQLALAAYQRSLTADWNQPQVAGRIARIQQSQPTTLAAAPLSPIVATVPAGAITATPGVPVTASVDGSAASPVPVPAYRQTTDSPLASQPFRPNANLPLARSPFQQTPSHPLASQPFRTNQAFLNVPAAPYQPVPQQGQHATPYNHAPR